MAQDEYWMEQAMQLAAQGAAAGEVPVGAVLVDEQGRCLAQAFNAPISRHDPCAHAEILVLREAAAKLGNYRLTGTTLYVTLEPCSMCAGALVHARVQRLVFAAREPKAGAVCSRAALLDAPYLNHQVQWQEGVLAEACSQQLSAFFQQRRAAKKQAKQAAKEND
ncbi:tRNA adenosine(34) deaminase TadA [Balneatrix alpica]|uniref:tRNA-specific adenosine deaminase n=1 Tax=Balneatrix alpica TaxID=75684 RepID=A0ABV5ZE44_9GAMM|nr:tRNA adenosine(34) deaminase TadA [Balneatrix alpica]